MASTPRKNRPPLTEVAYLAIKDDILSNRLRPGDPIPQDRLLKKLHLSRTPLREALLRLAKDGFIEIRPRMGTFVAQLDLLEIRDMYEVRRELEGLAARHAAGNVSPSRLEGLVERLEALDTGPDADLAALSDAGHEVHDLILEFCDNRVLVRFIVSLQEQFRRFRVFSLGIRKKVVSSHGEHLAILKALEHGNGEAVEDLVHAHFDHAAQYLMENLLRR
jgi:DNA-binding GntR family transcriptional regulator